MPTYRRPRRHPRTALEARAPFEFGQFISAGPLLARAPRGDGAPVLVLPGLSASDVSTRPLRAYLRRQGHHTHGWRLGRNEGPTGRIIRGLSKRVAQLIERHDEPIQIVGWSLGGVYALAIAEAAPGAVRRVITLGSPLAVLTDPRMPRSGLGPLVRERLGHRDGPPPPLTSIWSRTDAVVPWSASLAATRVQGTGEDIEVRSSHLGLGVNVAAVYAVADRLALPGAELPEFRPPWALRAAYPDPHRRRPAAATA
ncbi:MAG: alpha/beta hydrolase [Actinomycetota bacterium]